MMIFDGDSFKVMTRIWQECSSCVAWRGKALGACGKARALGVLRAEVRCVCSGE